MMTLMPKHVVKVNIVAYVLYVPLVGYTNEDIQNAQHKNIKTNAATVLLNFSYVLRMCLIVVKNCSRNMKHLFGW